MQFITEEEDQQQLSSYRQKIIQAQIKDLECDNDNIAISLQEVQAAETQVAMDNIHDEKTLLTESMLMEMDECISQIQQWRIQNNKDYLNKLQFKAHYNHEDSNVMLKHMGSNISDTNILENNDNVLDEPFPESEIPSCVDNVDDYMLLKLNSLEKLLKDRKSIEFKMNMNQQIDQYKHLISILKSKYNNYTHNNKSNNQNNSNYNTINMIDSDDDKDEDIDDLSDDNQWYEDRTSNTIRDGALLAAEFQTIALEVKETLYKNCIVDAHKAEDNMLVSNVNFQDEVCTLEKSLRELENNIDHLLSL